MSIFHLNASCVAARLLGFSMLISVAHGAPAQSSSTDKLLPPVVVTSSRVEQSQADALPHTTVITAADIRNSQATDLPSLLRREAGIAITQSGGPGQIASIFMRGAQPNETLILIDGVPIRRQGFAPAPAFEHILPEQIDRIEIVRGNVSAIYGSSAIGGVIQIFTKQGKGKPALNLSAEIGSRGTRQVSGGISGKSGDTRYALSLTGFKTDGFSANNTIQFPRENPDNDGYRNVSIGASISHEVSKGHEFGARIYGNDGKFDFDGGGFGARTDINEGRSKQHSVAAFSKNRFTENWASTVTVSQTGTRTRSTSVSAFPYDTGDNSDTTLLQWANEVSLASNWALIGGVDTAKEKADVFSRTSKDAFSRSTSSLYTGINGKAGSHQIQTNIRHDRVSGTGSDTTGYLGYGFELTPTVKLIANASTAFNAPSLLQLYDIQNGNRSLKSEASKSYELGAQYALNASIIRATFFKTKTENQFSLDPNNCFSGAYPRGCPTFNVARAVNQGFELSASGTLLDTDLRASLTLQDPKNDITGARLIRRAKTLAALSASKAFGAWRVGGDLQYTGARPDGIRKLDAYWLANFNTRYAISKELSVYGRIENAFDREYQTAYGYNQAPRGVFVGLSWQH